MVEESSHPVVSPAPAAPRSKLNEIRGKVQSVSHDPQTLRVTVEGGVNIEFAYDSKTAMVNGGSRITMADLSYGDEVIVHYSGKELYAVDIDRVGKAPHLQ